jgi:hypothetical protein
VIVVNRWAALRHPVFTGAVALLVVNDHVLKQAYPSWLTGKLSDFAGVFVITALLVICIRRPIVAGTGVVVGFGGIKLSEWAAALAAPVLGGMTRQDPSDLVALLAIGPAIIFVSGNRWSDARSTRKRMLPAVAVFLALGATTATSCASPEAVDALIVDRDGVVHARITTYSPYNGERTDELTRWASSRDGGTTWQASEAPANDRAGEPTTEVCTPVETCYAVDQGRGLRLREPGEEWRLVYGFSEEEMRRMNLRSTSCGTLDPNDDLFRSVAVHRGEYEGRVLVAMGTQGVLVGNVADGWVRREVLDLEPLPLSGPSWLADLGRFAMLCLLLIPALAFIAGLLLRRPKAGRAALASGVLALPVAGLVAFSLTDYAIRSMILVAMAIVVLVWSVFLLRKERMDQSAPPTGP